MNNLRRFFYLIIGLTFPGFWLFHAAGISAWAYRPIQLAFKTEATGWPSFVSAACLYILAIVVFEYIIRMLNRYQP